MNAQLAKVAVARNDRGPWQRNVNSINDAAVHPIALVTIMSHLRLGRRLLLCMNLCASVPRWHRITFVLKGPQFFDWRLKPS
jgi:hypothetical protein